MPRTRIRRPVGPPPIAPREWAVALTGAATLAFSAWGFGGVIAWSLHVLLVGGVATLLLAVFPVPGHRSSEVSSSPAPSLDTNGTPSHFSTFPLSHSRSSGIRWNGADGEHSNLKNILRLIKSPVFWFGGAFLLYLLIGALNPGIVQLRDERGWWVEAVEPPFGVHLPTSVQSDYEPMNAWRVFNMHLAAISLVWGFWAGLRRRKTVLLVLWVFVLSGVGMAGVAIYQHVSQAKEVLWTYESSNPQFWGSFFYRNQGAAYLNWVLVTTGCLYFYLAKRSREEGQSGGPHFLCVCFIGILAVSVGLALSRGGILFAALLSTAFLGLAVLQFIGSGFGLGRLLTIGLLLAALLGAGGVLAYRAIDWAAIEKRFGDISETIENAGDDARALSSQATWDMAQDRLWLGWGAGSFRYVFPMYQRNYPEIYYRYFHKKKQQWMGRKAYRYAHNDLLQFVAEYGVIGTGLVGLTILSLLGAGVRVIRDAPLSVLCLTLGCVAAVAHAGLDFIFNSPAYWFAFLGGIALVARLSVLDAERS
ncbi:O-antigen ligase family protein [Coraliomargarita parva]|uniref:O-antigen ligase family protein n=1 Tax=Coraliomargarita parva TaxID=3014050 RepID=UPI0022B33E4A|nr:O-antigen ligase family protein [Coraliomargarita parva]